jgi:hypothetical protein
MKTGAHPVAGYPSKTAAVLALRAEGKPYSEIASSLGISLESAYALNSQGRKVAAKASVANGPGIWTADKVEKARRLFGKTMIYIAEALQVPAEELLHYALDGKVPPMGRAGRLGTLVNEREAAAAAPALATPNLPALTAQPSRDDDEAELARLAALDEADETDDEPVFVPPQFRLKTKNGAWLHRDLNRVTFMLDEAWRGTAPDIERVYAANPKFKTYDPVPAA